MIKNEQMKLQIIDSKTAADHYYLEESDKCFYLGEYTSNKGYAHSTTNQLILNLKKSLEKKDTPEWKFKQQAINIYANAIYKTFQSKSLEKTIFVPVPPSKKKDDPLYDNRLVEILTKASAINNNNKFKILELVSQMVTTDCFHNNIRLKPNQLAGYYKYNTFALKYNPECIIVFDDILTTGSHFKAMQKVILENFPYPVKNIYGLFLARRIIPEDNIF